MGVGGGGGVPGSFSSSQPVPSLWHLLGDVTDVRFSSSPGKPRCPGPSRAHPRKRPSPRPYPPRQPRQARLPTWSLAVSAAAVPHPLLLLGCYNARSAMFQVSPGARRATTTGRVGARGAGASGRGGEAKPKLSTLHASLPQLLSMPSCPA